MEKVIDIFSRLLVATITFVVPILINLLSTFTAGENRRKALAKNAEEEISKRAAQEVQTNPDKIKETIGKSSQDYKDNEKKTKKELRLLNPLIQFWIIFSLLSISFLSLCVNYLVRNNWLNWYSHRLSFCTLLFSALAYLWSLFYIIRILYTITKTKKIIDSNN